MSSTSLSLVVSGASLLIAAATLARTWIAERRTTARARMTVYLHRTTEFAHVRLPTGETRRAGYLLVLANRGPAAARQITFSMFNGDGVPVQLLDVAPDEFPLDLDADAQYPIPLLLDDGSESSHRRYHVMLTWTDLSREAPHTKRVPLRRGQLPRSA